MKVRLLLVPMLFATLAFAGYDPAPADFLARCEGKWTGTLRYRDYSKPDQLVTLPTTLHVALVAADEIALHYVFDEGRGKSVHSYERIKVDRAAGQVSWSGAIADESYSGAIGSFDEKDGAVEIVVTRETIDDGKSEFMKYRFSFAGDALAITKEDGPNLETLVFRNEYRFTR